MTIDENKNKDKDIVNPDLNNSASDAKSGQLDSIRSLICSKKFIIPTVLAVSSVLAYSTLNCNSLNDCNAKPHRINLLGGCVPCR